MFKYVIYGTSMLPNLMDVAPANDPPPIFNKKFTSSCSLTKSRLGDMVEVKISFKVQTNNKHQNNIILLIIRDSKHYYPLSCINEITYEEEKFNTNRLKIKH